jgi:hypothetical protein
MFRYWLTGTCSDRHDRSPYGRTPGTETTCRRTDTVRERDTETRPVGGADLATTRSKAALPALTTIPPTLATTHSKAAIPALTTIPPTLATTHSKAAIPVSSCPTMSEWMSCVPS